MDNDLLFENDLWKFVWWNLLYKLWIAGVSLIMNSSEFSWMRCTLSMSTLGSKQFVSVNTDTKYLKN